MDFKVKSTTFLRRFSLLEILCPESCRGCGEKGEVLCPRCKKYIFRKYRNCAGEFDKRVFKKVYAVGYRDEIIGELVEEYKYYSFKGLARELGEILERTALEEFLNQNPGEGVIIVPLPTSRKHVRERGFDHVKEILKSVQKDLRGKVQVLEILERAKETVQVGASEKKRRTQAKEAYRLNQRFLDSEGRLKGEFLGRKIVLFDDIWTTGSSLTEGAKLLRKAGAREVYGVVLAVNRRGRKPAIRRGEF